MIGPLGIIATGDTPADHAANTLRSLAEADPFHRAHHNEISGPGFAAVYCASSAENAQWSTTHVDGSGNIVLFCGCLYNEKPPGVTDATYVSSRYQQLGVACFSDLNGTFALFIHDRERDAQYLVADRLSTWPVFYATTNDDLIFGPDLALFSNVPAVSRSLELSSIASFLASGYIPGTWTYLKAVRTISPGSYIRVQDRSVTHHSYWTYGISDTDDGRSPEECMPVLRDLLVRAVDRRVKRHPDATLLMSGGADSRALLGCCREVGAIPRLASYGTHRSPHSDAHVAARLAEYVGTDFDFVTYDVSDMMGYVRGSVAPFSGMRSCVYEHEALRKVGSDCDAVWIGDESFGWDPYAISTDREVLALLGITPFEQYREWKSVLAAAPWETLRDADNQRLLELTANCPLQHPHNRKDFLYTMLRLPRNILLGRRFTVTHSALPVLPWLDNDILDFMAQTSVSQRLGKQLFRDTARWAFPDLFAIPSALSSGRTGDVAWFDQALKRNAELIEQGCFQGNSPIDEWIDRGELLQFLSSSRPGLLQSIRSRIVASERTRLLQWGIDLSRRMRRRSRTIAAHRQRSAYSITPRLMVERLAQLRYYLGTYLGKSEVG